MTWTGLTLFAVTYGLAVATPGPGVTSLVARVLARGHRGVWAYIAGMALGDLLWLTIAATGLAVAAQHFAPALTAVRLAGAAYLLFIAWKLWSAPPPAADAGGTADEPPLRLFLSALSLTLGNPKVIVFFVALLPALVDLEHLTLGEFLTVASLCAALLSIVTGGYALAAHGARRLFTTPKAARRLNRATGLAMAGAALVVAARP